MRAEALDRLARPTPYLCGLGALLFVVGSVATWTPILKLGAILFLVGAVPSLFASLLVGRIPCASCRQQFWGTFRVGRLSRGCPHCGGPIFPEHAAFYEGESVNPSSSGEAGTD